MKESVSCIGWNGRWDFGSHRLWSLLEMLRVSAGGYLWLGMRMHDLFADYYLNEEQGKDKGLALSVKAPSADSVEHRREEFAALKAMCEQIGLTVSAHMLGRAVGDLPQTSRELSMLYDTIRSEIKDRLFLYIPPERARYYENDEIVIESAKQAFPRSSLELRMAGNCYAAGSYTACVFHSMRAAEIGVRALGSDLKISLKSPIELAEWQVILNGITGAITNIENQPRSAQRAEDLEFYSQAAAQFRFFKNGWRIRGAHAGIIFSENEAKEVIDHVCSFFAILAKRLKE